MFNSRTSVVHWLWNHNPFYLVSSLLMLYGVRAGFGSVEIGAINCWLMMSFLEAYTFLLALVGVLIIRWGKVWDDARSILLLLLLMFFAVSVSADDLFVKMESANGGAMLLACGFGFSVVILFGVLAATGIRLHLFYVVPLVLFLALFFAAPWWCSPELHPKNAMTLDWTLFLFPQLAAVLFLTLIPAARMGRASVVNNGTPWVWPLFPWSAFAFIGVAVVLRSYALTMTFSPSGPIWASPDSRSGIVLDTIWRPYFLVPCALAVLFLFLEAGLAAGNRRLVGRSLATAPCLLLLAWPWAMTYVMREFLDSLTATVGSPVWISTLMLIVFYGWAMIRRAANAEIGLLASILILSVVGPKTVSTLTLTDVHPMPMLVAGAAIAAIGLRKHSSGLIFVASIFLTAGLWFVLPTTPFSGYRIATCFHLMLAACLLISVLWRDGLAKQLQTVGAIMLIAPSIGVIHGTAAVEVRWEWRVAYVMGLAATAFFCARVSHGRKYWVGFVGTIAVLGEAIAVEGYRHASSVVGRNAVAAFSWSMGTLIIGFLISAQKARWIPHLSWIEWFEGLRPRPNVSLATSAVIEGEIDPGQNDQPTPML